MKVDISLLGGLRVSVDGRGVKWPTRRAAELVELLALSPGRHLHREQVVHALWPECDLDRAFPQLHKAATHIRQALGASEAVVLRTGTVALFPSAALMTDVDRFKVAVKGALAAGDRAACVAAAALYTGPLLPESLYTEWTVRERERLELLYLDALRAGHLWEQLVAVDVTDEVAHRELMRADIGAGNPGRAMRRFQRLRSTLADELGINPAPETIALMRQIAERCATAGADADTRWAYRQQVPAGSA